VILILCDLTSVCSSYPGFLAWYGADILLFLACESVECRASHDVNVSRGTSSDGDDLQKQKGSGTAHYACYV